jgi:hypothetical protein
MEVAGLLGHGDSFVFRDPAGYVPLTFIRMMKWL